MQQPLRVVLCGVRYGATYIRGLAHSGEQVRIVGILGRGSPIGRTYAQSLRCHYFTDLSQVQTTAVDAAVVAIGGDAGVSLAEGFLQRGVPVLQEHPLTNNDVLRLQQAAQHGRTVWHLNAHFGDLPSAQPFIAAAQRLASRSKPLFLTATFNPRTLFSVVDILGRVFPLLDHSPWEKLPHQEEERDFLGCLEGQIAGVPTSLRCQRTVSAHDDGSATLVSHHLEIGFADGVVELADTFGPALFRPNPGRDLSAWSHQRTEPPMWELLSPYPAPTPSQVQLDRDVANLSAVLAIAQHAYRGTAPPHQEAAYQARVAQTYDQLAELFGPPLLISPA